MPPLLLNLNSSFLEHGKYKFPPIFLWSLFQSHYKHVWQRRALSVLCLRASFDHMEWDPNVGCRGLRSRLQQANPIRLCLILVQPRAFLLLSLRVCLVAFQSGKMFVLQGSSNGLIDAVNWVFRVQCLLAWSSPFSSDQSASKWLVCACQLNFIFRQNPFVFKLASIKDSWKSMGERRPEWNGHGHKDALFA